MEDFLSAIARHPWASLFVWAAAFTIVSVARGR